MIEARAVKVASVKRSDPEGVTGGRLTARGPVGRSSRPPCGRSEATPRQGIPASLDLDLDGATARHNAGCAGSYVGQGGFSGPAGPPQRAPYKHRSFFRTLTNPLTPIVCGFDLLKALPATGPVEEGDRLLSRVTTSLVGPCGLGRQRLYPL